MNPYGTVLMNAANFESKHLVRAARRLRYSVMEATDDVQEFSNIAHKARISELTLLVYLLSECSSRMIRES